MSHAPVADGLSAAPRTGRDAGGSDGPAPVHPLVAQACAALDAEGVRWALLRGERDLGDPPGDVDLLIGGHSELHAVRRALRPLGIVAVPRLGAGAHEHLWGYHRPTRRWVEFDVEWSLDFGPQLHFTLNWLAPALRTGTTQAVLARRRRAPGLPDLWLLHPDDGFWALLLHVVVDKATVVAQHADHLLELSGHATATSPLAEVVTALCPAGWDAARVIRCAQAGEWPALVGLGRLLARRVAARRPVTHRVLAFGRGLRRLGGALGTALVTRGLCVVILAPDTAGRSALVGELVAGQPLGARHVSLDLGRPPRHPVLLRSLLGAGRRLLLRWRRLLAACHRLRGRMVVLEGHAADVSATAAPAGACRRPDLVIVLEGAGARRPADELPNVSGRPRREPAGTPTHVVRADRPPDEVLAEVTAIVWRAWAARRPRRTVADALRTARVSHRRPSMDPIQTVSVTEV